MLYNSFDLFDNVRVRFILLFDIFLFTERLGYALNLRVKLHIQKLKGSSSQIYESPEALWHNHCIKVKSNSRIGMLEVNVYFLTKNIFVQHGIILHKN